MKQFRRVFSISLLILFGFISAIQAENGIKTEIRDIRNFHAITVSAGIDLFISMGGKEEVKVVADGEIIDDIETTVRGGTLHVTFKEGNWFNIFNWGRTQKPRKVFVQVKELKGIHVSSGADVKSENRLRGKHLEMKASSGCDADLEVDYEVIKLETSSGSDVRLKGIAGSFIAHASSGSDINARNLDAVVCDVTVNSGSDATVSAREELTAKASSGGDIRYYGNPQVKEIETSSGGDISGRQ